MPIVHPTPCAGQCGKKLRLREVHKPMCKGCQEGADILNRNAIRLAKMTAEEALEALSNPTKDLALYNILHRNAGWAIQWHSLRRQENPPAWAADRPNKTERGLFVNRYYRTFTEMVKGELQWLRVSGN